MTTTKQTFKAVYDGAVLRPEEPVDLEPNAKYQVTIEIVEPEGADSDSDVGPFDRILALARELDLPPDFSAQIDHYLYGLPKR